jgi:23S rRNA U2552 (ribose-2'-O)-methylase RlmE/FtsJ
MSYYILPKNNNSIDINLKSECHDIKSYTSQSLYNFYKESKKQLNFFLQTNDSIITFENLLKVINPYEYIFSKIPGYKYSVSKLKTKSNIFYDVLEIFITLNVLDSFLNKSIKSIHISENYIDSNKCINFLRENHNDENTNFEDITEEIYHTINDKRYDFIFYEIKNTEFENLNYYTLNIIQVLMILLKYQSNNGVCLIKINNIFHKPIIDILYILCSIYEKVYIIKPNTSNIMSSDKYIVCKNFTLNENKKELYRCSCR